MTKIQVDLMNKQMQYLKIFKNQKWFMYRYEIVNTEDFVEKLTNFLTRVLMLSLKFEKMIDSLRIW